MAASKFQEQVQAKRTGRLTLGLCLAMLLTPIPYSSALALEISKHKSDSPALNAVQLTGPIKSGDARALNDFLAKLPQKPATLVVLDSSGGMIDEGMALGRVFHALGIRTSVMAKPARCLSACALAFLGGRDGPSGRPSRTMASEADIGFQNFQRTFGIKAYDFRDMNIVVAETQAMILEVANYLDNVGADLEVLRMMLKSQDGNVIELDRDTALRLGISVLVESPGSEPSPGTKARN